MTNHRVSRLNEQLRRELTDIIRNELRDPRVGMVTITDVRTTSDLEHARIAVSVMGEPAEQQETLVGLRAAAPFMRGLLGKRLHIRHTPELRFEIDTTLEHARRIEQLLASVRPAPEPAPDDAQADEELADAQQAESERNEEDDDVA